MSVNSYPKNFPDILFGDDLDLYARECPNDYVGLKQDVLHLEKQGIGSNLDDLTKGIDLQATSSGTLAALQGAGGELEEQLAHDDRIDTASVNVIQRGTGPAAKYTLDVQVKPAPSVLSPATGASR